MGLPDQLKLRTEVHSTGGVQRTHQTTSAVPGSGAPGAAGQGDSCKCSLTLAPWSLPSFGGLILNKTVSKLQFKGMAVFAPIICGVGGNLVAIQTSRVSTYLHMWSTPGVLPLWMKAFWPNPCSTFCSSEINSTSARVLLFLVVPGHLIFFYIIYLVEGQSVPNDRSFVVLYLLAGLVQVAVLLYLAEVMVRLMWRQALDPDNHCIPYLTGLGDLLGTGLLALCFLVHWLLVGTLEPVSGAS